MVRDFRWLRFGCALLVLLIASVEAKVMVMDPGTLRPVNDSRPVPLQRHILDRARGCFDSGQLLECARVEVIRLVERAIDSNVTVRVSPFLSVRRNPDWRRRTIAERNGSPGGWLGLLQRLREFLVSRVLQFSLADGGGGADSWLAEDEARGKKHKNKQGGMFSMALMALMAMIAQVILGKVAVLAAVALIMAKIALVFSTLNGLKKVNGSGGGHGSDHVVYEHSSHGGGGGGGGWQRSIDPRKPHQRYPTTYYDDEEALPYRKRRPDFDYQDALDGA